MPSRELSLYSNALIMMTRVKLLSLSLTMTNKSRRYRLECVYHKFVFDFFDTIFLLPFQTIIHIYFSGLGVIKRLLEKGFPLHNKEVYLEMISFLSDSNCTNRLHMHHLPYDESLCFCPVTSNYDSKL